MNRALQRAVFLDRDGTLVEPRHYPSRPDELRLYSGIAAELKQLQQQGFLLVVVTNQSGIARGYFSESDLATMHDDLRKRLRRKGVELAGIYHCSHHPDGVVSDLATTCGCRKPAPGMLLQAASDLSIDLHRSWLVGDILDDVEAGRRAGCRTILVDLGTERLDGTPIRTPDFVCGTTREALRVVVDQSRIARASVERARRRYGAADVGV